MILQRSFLVSCASLLFLSVDPSRHRGLVDAWRFPSLVRSDRMFRSSCLVQTALKPLSASQTDISPSPSSSYARSDPTQQQKQQQSLKNVICLVTGASRGIGKGIAMELGAQGATVYVTGTSTTTQTITSQTTTTDGNTNAMVVPGTIEETAALIARLGGIGIPIRCDHSNDADVQHVMDRIGQEQNGRLDILVNNAFQLPAAGVEFLNKNFWEQGAEAWDSIHTVGLRSHYMATCCAMPLLFESGRQIEEARSDPNSNSNKNRLTRPLIVMIGSFGGLTYTFNVAYGVGKAGVDRLAKDMAVELASHDICVVSLWPGVVDTERTKLAVANGDWDRFVGVPLDTVESPQFTGRAVVALCTDSPNMKKSGSIQVVAELADEYDFTDIDGKRPPSIRSLRFLLPNYAFDAATRAKIPASWIPDFKLPFWLMAQGRKPEKI